MSVTSTSVVVPFTSAGYLTTSINDSYSNITLTNSHQVKFNALYVKSDGDDTTGVGSIASPYVTLTKAYNMAEDTSTIYVMDNITYNETTSFDDNKNITLTSCTKESDTSCPTSTANSIIRGSSLNDNYMFTTTQGTLNLNTIIINGNNVDSTKAMINNKAILRLNANSTLKNGNNNTNYGGAIYNQGDLTITSAAISNNTAIHSGGGIFNTGGEVVINSITMNNNKATNNGGGGLYNTDSGTVTIKGGTFQSNTAQYGGALYNMTGKMTINAGNFYKNSCTISGGVLHAYGTVYITGGTFGGSTANANKADSGGAIRIPNNNLGKGTLNMSGGTISYNSSTSTAGGISNSGTLNLSGTAKISNNTAGTSGGGIHNLGTLTIDGATISNNTAGYGGAINNAVSSTYDFIGKTIIKSGTISNNKAVNTNGESGNGGGNRFYCRNFENNRRNNYRKYFSWSSRWNLCKL